MYEELIPSRTVREYAEKTGHVFSDVDIAAIVYHQAGGERTPALRKLAAQTEDTTLREQIQERLAYEAQLWERFEHNDGSFFYAVKMTGGTGRYTSAKAALAAGKATKSPFGVSKYELVDLRDKSAVPPYIYFDSFYYGQPVAEYWYDKDSAPQMFLCWSHEITQEEWERMELWNAARFEERFVSLPNPFRRGDVVCWVNTPEEVGVVETSQEEWQDIQAKKRDFISASVEVEWLKEDGKFTRGQVQPIHLERATLDKTDGRKPLLEAAGRLLRGEGTLDELFRARERYLAHVKKQGGEEMSWHPLEPRRAVPYLDEKGRPT